jgi:hypothetical protein
MTLNGLVYFLIRFIKFREHLRFILNLFALCYFHFFLLICSYVVSIPKTMIISLLTNLHVKININ